jgi:beta-phosphoglucomutase-like phosphatase (HAD superfamily)
VLFDMDGVLCNSEEPSRQAAVDLFAEMGVDVSVEDFIPFTGTGDDLSAAAAAGTGRSDVQYIYHFAV